MVQALLEHATTVFVSGHHQDIVNDGAINELAVIWRVLVQDLLDNVVTVQVLDQLDDIRLQALHQKRQLVAIRHVVNDFLQRPGAMLVDGNQEQVVLQDFQHKIKVSLRAVVHQFLHKVVTKRIDNKLVQQRMDFFKDHLEIGHTGQAAGHHVLVNAFLKKTTPILVLCQAQNVASQQRQRSLQHQCQVVLIDFRWRRRSRSGFLSVQAETRQGQQAIETLVVPELRVGGCRWRGGGFHD